VPPDLFSLVQIRSEDGARKAIIAILVLLKSRCLDVLERTRMIDSIAHRRRETKPAFIKVVCSGYLETEMTAD